MTVKELKELLDMFQDDLEVELIQNIRIVNKSGDDLQDLEWDPNAKLPVPAERRF